MKRVLKIGLGAVGIILVLLVGVLAYFAIRYSPEYLRRVIVLGQSDYYDYQRFPERTMDAAAEPFHFQASVNPAAAEARVRVAFEADPMVGGDLDAFLAARGTQAFLVIQDDTLLYEHYFGGFQRNSIVTSFSAAKSFDSTLVEMAVEEGLIGSLDDPITDYLPELAERDPHFSDITIRHLLNMASGIRYVETGFVDGDDALTYYYPDLRALALHETQIQDAPGAHWLYNNYHPLLIGLILERATGRPVTAYLEAKIWQPLGMEYGGSWSLDSAETAFEKMESGINARAIDFAKLGRLYLNEGNWDGAQLLAPEWIAAATTLDPAVDRASYYPAWMEASFGQVYHQLQWWGVHFEDGSYGYSAIGHLGQFIFVWPEQHLIIVRHGESWGFEGEFQAALEWLRLFSVGARQLEV